MPQKKPTPEQIKEMKEYSRKLSLEILKTENSMNLASAYLVHKSGAYGKEGDSAVDKFKFFPSFNSNLKVKSLKDGKEHNLFEEAILNSRQGGEIGTGNISEHQIKEGCYKIMEESLDHITIGDLYSLMSGKEVKKEFNQLKDVYLGELNLAAKIPKAEFEKLPENQQKIIYENQKLYEKFVGLYQNDLMDKAVSESLGEKRKSNLKSLEGILVEGEGR